jgi:hypothetical protein
MDADLEDLFILLHTCCKALLDFDEASPAMVENESDAKDDDDMPILASITFFRVVQFLFFVALDKMKAYIRDLISGIKMTLFEITMTVHQKDRFLIFDQRFPTNLLIWF